MLSTCLCQALCALLKCVPSQEELELVTSANVPVATLGLAERFVFHVGFIPPLTLAPALTLTLTLTLGPTLTQP